MFTVAALYHFTRFDDPAALRDPLLAVCNAHHIGGTLLLAREANVMIDDAGFAQTLRAQLDEAIERDSTALELSRHRGRPWPQRAMNWVSFVLLRVAVAITGQGGDY